MREWLAEVERRLGPTGLDGAAEREVAEELAQHLEDRYTELRAAGESHANARAQVLLELGDDDSFTLRLRRLLPARPEPLALGRPTFGGVLSGVWSDLKFGARMLARTRVHTTVSILVMALGIGANTAIFMAVNSLLLEPPGGVADPERLAAIFTSDYSGPRFGANSYPDIEALRAEPAVFEAMGASSLQTFRVVGDGWDERGMGEIVSGSYFEVFGVRPRVGRFFSEEESTVGKQSSVVVLGHTLWQQRFGGAADAIGRTVHIRGVPHTVIGVAPVEFGGALHGLRSMLWLPLSASPSVVGEHRMDRGSRGFMAVARLRAGVDVTGAQQMADVVAQRLHAEYPDNWTDASDQSRVFTVLPESEARVPPRMRGLVIGYVGLLMAAVFAILMIACTNVANLMLARASARRAEMGVRLALGASRGRIVRHMLAESVLLAALGGMAGVLLAYWLMSLLRSVRLPGLHVMLDVSFDVRVVAFAAGLTLATGILFGLAPALRASHAPAPMLKDDGRGSARSRVRSGLVIAQVAVSLVLLVVGGLFVRSLRAAQQLDTGYAAGSVVLASFNMEDDGYSPERAQEFFDRLLERTRSLPGIEAATLVRDVPLSMGWSRRSIIVDEYRPAEGEDMEVMSNSVGPDYFRTMGMRLVRGRDFTDADRAGAPPVLIVSEAFARRFWPGQNALGKRVGLGVPDAPFAEVIGVAPDALYRSLDEETHPYFYFPYRQEHELRANTIMVRSSGEPNELAITLRREIAALAPGLPMPAIMTFSQHLAFAALPQRVAALLLGTLGLLGVTIAVIGLYGLTAYSATRRIREFGIRIALGAVPRDVRRMVVGEALRLVGIGVVCGAPVAIAGAFVASRFLLVAPIDPVPLLAVTLLLGAAALLASYAPARRATAVDPSAALRAE